MTTPGIHTVTARRAVVARELAELEKMRAQMQAEDGDLEVAERVLKRLAVALTSGSPEFEDARQILEGPLRDE